MIVPITSLPTQQTMVGEPEQFARNQYGAATYENETCYSNTDSTDAAAFQYRDWEMRVYNQVHGHPTTTDTEFLLAARKVQETYPYGAPEVASYPGYPSGEYVSSYPHGAHPQTPTAYYGDVVENMYYNPENLAAQQYYHQQHAASNDLYYNGSRHHTDEEFVGGYDGSSENLSYQSTGSSGRPSPHQHYDRSSMPSSPDCHKFAAMYVQSPNGLMQRADNAALLCAVCGDNAACQHYGVRTCEGCKGFFKRTVQKKAKYVCLADKKCPVDKRRRNRCQFCRFQKCLAVGMVKEVVRSDSLKGRRGRLPSKPKSPNDKPVSPPLPLITTLVRAHMEQTLDIPNFNFVGDYSSSEKEMISKLLDHLVQNVNVIKCFFTRGNGAFAELLPDDKEKISQKRCFHFFLLRLAQRMKVTHDMITLPGGTVYYRSQLQGALGELLSNIADFAVELQRSDLDIQSFACMLILTILGEKSGVKAPMKIESAESKVVDSLRDHCTYNPEAQNQPHLYSRAVNLLTPLDSLCQHLISRLQQTIYDSTVPVPSQISQLFPRPVSPPALTIPSHQL